MAAYEESWQRGVALWRVTPWHVTPWHVIPWRLAALVAASFALAGLGGCSLWPWSSSKPALPELPAVTAPANARVVWSLSLSGAGVGFQPVAAANSLFAAARDGTVVRIDPASGSVQWRTDLGQPLIAGVGSDGETTVVAGLDGSLIALGGDGAPKWSVPSGAEVVTVPSVALGLVLVRTSDNRVAAFDADTGKRRWTFHRQGPPLVLRQTSLIAMDATAAYVGLPGGRLVSLSLETGALRWEAAVAMPRGSNEIERIADVVGSPLVSGREVCAVAFQGRVGCFESSSGRARWARDLSSASGLDLDASLLVVPDERGELLAFSRSGASVWRQAGLRQRGLSAPLLTPRFVLVGDSTGLVHLLARDDGAIAARLPTDASAVVAAPVGAAGLAIVQTRAGALFAISDP